MHSTYEWNIRRRSTVMTVNIIDRLCRYEVCKTNRGEIKRVVIATIYSIRVLNPVVANKIDSRRHTRRLGVSKQTAYIKVYTWYNSVKDP